MIRSLVEFLMQKMNVNVLESVLCGLLKGASLARHACGEVGAATMLSNADNINTGISRDQQKAQLQHEWQ